MDIARISEISYNEFVGKYLSKNLPCLLNERFTKNWKSRKEWISGGKPCFKFLRKSFGMDIIKIRRQQKFYSLRKRYKQIRRFEQRPFVGN